MFDPMSISVSAEKPFCGIISVKKVIELFTAAERIPDSMYDNSYHHGGYFYVCSTTNVDYCVRKFRYERQCSAHYAAV